LDADLPKELKKKKNGPKCFLRQIRQAQWSLELSEYNFTLIHKPGRQHAKTDALSRRDGHEEIKEKWTLWEEAIAGGKEGWEEHDGFLTWNCVVYHFTRDISRCTVPEIQLVWIRTWLTSRNSWPKSLNCWRVRKYDIFSDFFLLISAYELLRIT
jgi:hypothetical protein